jgi:hypothetical protein
MRTILLDYVQQNGAASWKELHNIVLIVAGQPLTNKHWGSGYLDQVSYSSVCFPTRNDPRFLFKASDGLYHIYEG